MRAAARLPFCLWEGRRMPRAFPLRGVAVFRAEVCDAEDARKRTVASLCVHRDPGHKMSVVREKGSVRSE